jgi:hypothetical protein
MFAVNCSAIVGCDCAARLSAAGAAQRRRTARRLEGRPRRALRARGAEDQLEFGHVLLTSRLKGEAPMSYVGKRATGVLLMALVSALDAFAQSAQSAQPATNAPGREARADGSYGTGTIKGQVVDAVTGRGLPRVALELNGGQPAGSAGETTDEDGAFEFRGLPPGRYSIQATKATYETGYLPESRRGRQPRRLELASGATLDKLTAPMGGSWTVSVQPDFTFSMKVIGDRLQVATGAQGWYMRSILQGTDDVTIDGIRFGDRSSVSDVVISFTDRPTKLSATVADAKGNAADEFLVAVFPVDKARRPRSRNFGQRYFVCREAGPTADGSPIRLDGLLPGDYFVIALTPDDYDASGMPDSYDALEPLAQRFTLGEGDVRVISLTIVDLPDSPR